MRTKNSDIQTACFLKAFPICSFEEGAVMGLGGSGPEKLVDT